MGIYNRSDDLLWDMERMKMIRYDSVVIGTSRPLPVFQFPKDRTIVIEWIYVHRLLFEKGKMEVVLHVGS